MTTPRRWYQLSMLQLLVAMAVVATLVWLNRPVPFWLEFDVGGTLKVGDSQGWPINFRPFHWTTIPLILTPSANPSVSIASPPNTVTHEINLLALLVDIAIGVLIVTGALMLVGKFGKRKVLCPSPPT